MPKGWLFGADKSFYETGSLEIVFSRIGNKEYSFIGYKYVAIAVVFFAVI